MNKEELKKHMLRMQQNVITELEELISSKHSMVDLDEEDTMDPEDFSHQYESGEMEQLITTKLNKAKRSFDVLSSINFADKKCAEPGAIIETNTFNFVIGQATIPFEFEGKKMVGVSVESPIYTVLLNKNEGDTFSFSGIDYEIKKIR